MRALSVRPQLRFRHLALALSIGLSGAPRPVSGKSSPLSTSSWLVYWDVEAGLRTLAEFGVPLEEVAIFGYQFDPDGNVVPAASTVPETLTIVRQLPLGARPRVLVTVVNDQLTDGPTQAKSPDCVHAVLADPAARARHVTQVLAISEDADGLELDYENLRAKDRAAFTALVQELAAQLHQRGQRLSVVVQPKTTDAVRDGAGAMDWRALAAAADTIKVMAYHYHYPSGKPGPVAPPQWVGEVAHFAAKRIPHEKLVVILTMAGFDWPSGGRGRSIHYDQACLLATKWDRVLERDRKTRSPHFRYYDDAGQEHQVWLEDAESIQRKLHVVRQAGVEHVALWYLGRGDANLWLSLGRADASP